MGTRLEAGLGMRLADRPSSHQVQQPCHGHFSDVGVEVDEGFQGGAKAGEEVVARYRDEEVLTLL